MKTFEFFCRNVYGQELEYLKNNNEAIDFFRLTGKRTINKEMRLLISRLFEVQFLEVLPPESEPKKPIL